MTLPASDRAYTAIREGLMAGRWPGGSWLREPELGAELNVSRTPVREALRRLASEGLVVHVPNRGVQVTVLSEHDVLDITAMRALIESYAAQVAATRMRSDELAPLQVAADLMCKLVLDPNPDLAAIAECNAIVHDGLISAARSSYLVLMLETVRRQPITMRTFAQYTRDELIRSARQHTDILAAVEAHDPEWARVSMSAHLLTARSSLLRGLETLSSAGGDPRS